MPNYILDLPQGNVGIKVQSFCTFAHLDSIDDLTDSQLDFDRLAQKYGVGKNGKVKFGFNGDGSPSSDFEPWQEINFGSINPFIGKDGTLNIIGVMLDSYTIQAIRAGNFFNQSQLAALCSFSPTRGPVIENAIQGMLVKNGKFPLGLRGGTELAGRLQPIPGGSVRWKDKYVHDPFMDAFESEAKEEFGATISAARCYGVFNQVPLDPSQAGHINRQWVYVGEPRSSLEDLVALTRGGIEFYRGQISQGKNGRQAKMALRESGFPEDAWENDDVWLFDYDPDTFLQLLSDGQWTSSKGRVMKLIGSLPANLYMAGVADFGEEFKKKADKLELASKEIVKVKLPK